MKMSLKVALIVPSAFMTMAIGQTPGVPGPPTPTPTTLTLSQAGAAPALKNNPRIAVSRLLALAQGQVTRETRSAELPTMTGNLTAVESHDGSRITAGALNNPIVYERGCRRSHCESAHHGISDARKISSLAPAPGPRLRQAHRPQQRPTLSSPSIKRSTAHWVPKPSR